MLRSVRIATALALLLALGAFTILWTNTEDLTGIYSYGWAILYYLVCPPWVFLTILIEYRGGTPEARSVIQAWSLPLALAFASWAVTIITAIVITLLIYLS